MTLQNINLGTIFIGSSFPYVLSKSSTFNVVQYNTTSRLITFHRPNLNSLTGKILTTKLRWSADKILFLYIYIIINLNLFFN